MMSFDDVVAGLEDLDPADLTRWIEARWVLPLAEGQAYHFSEVDVARVRFLCELRYDLNITDETVDLVLPLIDQIHALRRTLNTMTTAIEAQPDDIRQSIAESLSLGVDRQEP